MSICATAKVVAVAGDAEACYALVEDPAHVVFLQQECRIYGSPEGGNAAAASTCQRLRLALEEMAVGVTKGFLRLEAPIPGPRGSEAMDNEDWTLVQEIAQELVGGGQCRESTGSAEWRLSSRRHARLHVFRDLWERGYVVTFGSKFGADFLIYKDDPKRTHAIALVVVKDYDEEFARVDIISFCRVAKMVKKQFMLACVQHNCEESREKSTEAAESTADSVVYISLSHALLVSRQEESES